MPEYREGTPVELRDLESFLWWDFDALPIWNAWTEQRGFIEPQTEYAFAEVCEVQKAMRDLESANSGIATAQDVSGAFDRINDAMEEHLLRPTIGMDGVRVSARPGDPLGHVLQLALLAMTNRQWPRFKLCRDATCRASFFDASKNGTKTWCSMDICGSRNKMRRLRSRARACERQ